MANELNETVLDSALAELPGLLGLHVIGCAKVGHVAVLRLVSHTPLLESLSLTTGVGGLCFDQFTRFIFLIRKKTPLLLNRSRL
jgi:hypothetical protein